MGLLDGKRLLITGVITDASIAFHAAKIAQEQGAQVVLTGFGRMSLVERVAQRLPAGRARRRARRRRPGASRQPRRAGAPHLGATGLDGVLHSIGFAPASCLGDGASWTRRGRTSRPRPGAARTRSSRWPSRRCRCSGPAVVDRRARLRRPAGLARLRLDGRREVRAGVGHPLPRPRPRAAGDPGEPVRGRAGAHDGRQVHPRLRRVRGRLGRAGAAGLERRRPGAGRARRCARCCRTGCPSPPARWCGPTAGSTPIAAS